MRSMKMREKKWWQNAEHEVMLSGGDEDDSRITADVQTEMDEGEEVVARCRSGVDDLTASFQLWLTATGHSFHQQVI